MSEWDKAFAALEAIRAEDAEFQLQFDRIDAAFIAGRPKMDDIPFREFPLLERNYVARSLDLERYWQRFIEAENKTWWSNDGDRMKERKRAAIDAVHAFRAAEECHARDTGYDAANDRYDELSHRIADAEGKLMATPAPDRQALLWKLEKLLEVDHGSTAPWSEEYVEQTKSDMRRLLAE